MLPFVASAPAVDHWAAMSGIVLLGLGLVFFVWFYRRLALRIRRSERLAHELLEAAPFAIAVTRRQTGEFLFANRRAINLLALSPTGYRSQRIPYANGPTDRVRVIEALARDGQILDSEIDLVAMDGRRFPSLGSIVPIEFAGEEAFLGAFQDVTKVKETELQVRASEARLRGLFETVPDGIVVLNADGTVLQASDSCAALIGDDDVACNLGRPILDFIAESDRPIAREMLANIAAGQPRETAAYRIARPDGTMVWLEPRGVPVHDPITGQPLIILVLRNITKRREAQDQLTEHAAKLQEALDRIAHLQNAIVRVCAWTKKVYIDGQWIPIDHYLAKYLGLKISHGISEEGLAMLGVPPEEPPSGPGTEPTPETPPTPESGATNQL
jgi:PAS domain S-box-containing protein